MGRRGRRRRGRRRRRRRGRFVVPRPGATLSHLVKMIFYSKNQLKVALHIKSQSVYSVLLRSWCLN
jgi:hypothetical protein